MNPVYLKGFGFWTIGYPEIESWMQKMADPEATQPLAKILEGSLRRRAAPLTRMSVEVMQQAVQMAGCEISCMPSVWGTAHGEHSTAIGLLGMMHRGSGKLSPTKFHNSVHNTPSGYASISTQNQMQSTTITGGAEIVVSVLCEAIAMVADLETDVAVTLADEPLMSPFHNESCTTPLGISFVLSPSENRAIAALGSIDRHKLQPMSMSPHFGRLHVSAALPLIEAAYRGSSGIIPVQFQESPSDETWCIELQCLPNSVE